ncbi:DUF3613 domain-containing protein [uncultured Xylophilus sp.]|uniref:DUF3613 domain-containing protein n=1 Tax=uncultured Xylophilus sp. TaxID=296832 RepID=UPI0025DB32DC|nr:DUF3613 domain-containing protein [uncultured Xylophilus sp.]
MPSPLHRLAPVLVVLTATVAAHAQPADRPAAVLASSSVPQPGARIGDAARALRDLQSGGSAASTTPRPIAGDVAGLSYQRYLDTFKQPIPPSFTPTVAGVESSR